MATRPSRIIRHAEARAELALLLYTQPQEVCPGLFLCCRGQVYYAMHFAGGRPREAWPQILEEVERLATEAERRQAVWEDAWHNHSVLCTFSGISPVTPSVPPCDCEGCRIFADNIVHIEQSGT